MLPEVVNEAECNFFLTNYGTIENNHFSKAH